MNARSSGIRNTPKRQALAIELRKLFKVKKKILIDKEQLKIKASEIDTKIKKLEAVRDGLIHACNCKAPSHLECPTFQRLLSIATKKQLKNKN